MKHDHAVEISVAPELQKKIDHTREYLQNNKKAYLFGLGGVALGVLGTRIFSRSAVTQVVVVHALTAVD